MGAQGFETPEQAAMVGFPEKYCRVVASADDGDCAYVLLDTGSDGRSYFYGVICSRRGGRWHEVSSSNGGGWSLCGSPGDELGMLAFWDDAPANAEAVRIEFRGEVQELSVTSGTFLAMWWRLPSPASDWPCVQAYRIDGNWITTW